MYLVKGLGLAMRLLALLRGVRGRARRPGRGETARRQRGGGAAAGGDGLEGRQEATVAYATQRCQHDWVIGWASACWLRPGRLEKTGKGLLTGGVCKGWVGIVRRGGGGGWVGVRLVGFLLLHAPPG